jgi:hypothetical protein
MEIYMSDRWLGESVAVVGAGMAGLSCARELTDAGLRVTVFEKSRGVSGRMSTRCVAADTNTQQAWQCDHGAQYFSARNPLFCSQVKRWEDAGVVAQWQPRIDTVGVRPQALGADPKKVQRYVGIPRMTAPAHMLASGIELIANTRITGIEHRGEAWFLTQEGLPDPVGPFRHLVLAIPAQQAADLLASITHHSGHTTGIKQALSSCRQYALRPCWALILHFVHTQIESNDYKPDFDAAFVNSTSDHNCIASWVARDSSKPDRLHNQADTWLLHASPAWSEQHLEADQQWVFDQLLAEFRRVTGIRAQASNSGLHRWRYAQAGNTDNSPGQLWLNDLSLGLCGDWLNGGRVEGAWLSGYQLAQRMLAAS